MLAAVILAIAMSQTGKSDRTAWVALVQLVSEALQTPSAQTRASRNTSPELEAALCSAEQAIEAFATAYGRVRAACADASARQTTRDTKRIWSPQV